MHSKLSPFIIFIIIATITIGCKNKNINSKESKNIVEKIVDEVKEIPVEKAPEIHYSIIRKADWMAQKDSLEAGKHLDIIAALNRTDQQHLNRQDSLIIPDRFDLALDDYMPFPKQSEALKDIDKIIVFSNAAQVFAAYENGKLVLQGQSNMGKKSTPTPAKLYFCNWKAKRSVSTVNSKWILNWNFNISNFGGIGFHEYAMPGYPASHSCMRLLASDAKFLYDWAEQWILSGNTEIAKGTPVIIAGEYPYGSARPWYDMVNNPDALRYNEASMKDIVAPYLDNILQQQQKRKEQLGKSEPAV